KQLQFKVQYLCPPSSFQHLTLDISSSSAPPSTSAHITETIHSPPQPARVE
ncbi:hypothetical protein JOQ06_002423, partial [Pogonophryne albipinna]